MITSTTEGQRDNSLVVPVQMSRAISEFPTEIVRLVFETSVAPGAQVGGDQQRQRSGYACCLVSKEVKAWVEPMLYERVVLESSTQVMAFLDALELKSAGFLTRTMKAVWILDNSFPDNAINRFQLLSSKCLSLEHLVYLGDEPCSRILQTLLEVHSAPLALRELTVIQPRHDNALCLDLTHQLSIQKLQIVYNDTLLTAHFLDRAVRKRRLLDALRAIPQIYLDFNIIRGDEYAVWIKAKLIPLLIGETPESKSVLNLRSSSLRLRKIDDRSGFQDVGSWVEMFDTVVKQYEGRFLVCVKPDSEVGIDLGDTDTEQCKAWIGLY